MKMMKNKCLFCYQLLNESEIDFHFACSKKMFGIKNPPIIEFDTKKFDELAKQMKPKCDAVLKAKN